MSGGKFITFEGGEGGGKSTQSRRLAEKLRSTGYKVVLTREPGGAPGSEAIRALLVSGDPDRWSPLAEALLFAAARDEHLRTTIRPALARGEIVVCDRFADSTRAYQGAAGGVPHDTVAVLEDMVVGTTRPDLTIILDIDPDAGMARAAERGEGEDRFERKAAAFHLDLRKAFLAIAAAEPERCIVIDAAGDADQVAAAVWPAVSARLGIGAPDGAG